MDREFLDELSPELLAERRILLQAFKNWIQHLKKNEFYEQKPLFNENSGSIKVNSNPTAILENTKDSIKSLKGYTSHDSFLSTIAKSNDSIKEISYKDIFLESELLFSSESIKAENKDSRKKGAGEMLAILQKNNIEQKSSYDLSPLIIALMDKEDFIQKIISFYLVDYGEIKFENLMKVSYESTKKSKMINLFELTETLMMNPINSFKIFHCLLIILNWKNYDTLDHLIFLFNDKEDYGDILYNKMNVLINNILCLLSFLSTKNDMIFLFPVSLLRVYCLKSLQNITLPWDDSFYFLDCLLELLKDFSPKEKSQFVYRIASCIYDSSMKEGSIQISKRQIYNVINPKSLDHIFCKLVEALISDFYYNNTKDKLILSLISGVEDPHDILILFSKIILTNMDDCNELLKEVYQKESIDASILDDIELHMSKLKDLLKLMVNYNINLYIQNNGYQMNNKIDFKPLIQKTLISILNSDNFIAFILIFYEYFHNDKFKQIEKKMQKNFKQMSLIIIYIKFMIELLKLLNASNGSNKEKEFDSNKIGDLIKRYEDLAEFSEIKKIMLHEIDSKSVLDFVNDILGLIFSNFKNIKQLLHYEYVESFNNIGFFYMISKFPWLVEFDTKVKMLK